MNTQLKELFMQGTSLTLVIWLMAGLLLMGDWFNASLCQARGAAAARGPNGGAVARGPNGGAAARGPNGAVVAAPRGRVAAVRLLRLSGAAGADLSRHIGQTGGRCRRQ